MTFTPEVYEIIRAGAVRSAEVIVPIVRSYVEPERVVDVGCGEGWFARQFAELGSYVLGLDESVSLSSEDPGPHRTVQFENGGCVEYLHSVLGRDPLTALKSFDLAVCLEVAEHLRETEAEALVEGLASIAPVILFSAAIPGQGGHAHINEQWPDYWADLFYEHGLVCTEELRWEFWDDEKVEPWYRQNLLLFASYTWFDEKRLSFTKYPRRVVHPTIWSYYRSAGA